MRRVQHHTGASSRYLPELRNRRVLRCRLRSSTADAARTLLILALLIRLNETGDIDDGSDSGYVRNAQDNPR